MDWTDLKNATSVSFSGITLTKYDFVQLANVPNLASIAIEGAPVDEENFLLLRHLPNLSILILKDTGASDPTLKNIDEISSQWRVFASQEELKRWSLERVNKLQAEKDSRSPAIP